MASASLFLANIYLVLKKDEKLNQKNCPIFFNQLVSFFTGFFRSAFLSFSVQKNGCYRNYWHQGKINSG